MVEYNNLDHTRDIAADSGPHGTIFKILANCEKKQDLVLTRFVPDPENKKEKQRYYCLFEENRLAQSETEKLAA